MTLIKQLLIETLEKKKLFDVIVTKRQPDPVPYHAKASMALSGLRVPSPHPIFQERQKLEASVIQMPDMDLQHMSVVLDGSKKTGLGKVYKSIPEFESEFPLHDLHPLKSNAQSYAGTYHAPPNSLKQVARNLVENGHEPPVVQSVTALFSPLRVYTHLKSGDHDLIMAHESNYNTHILDKVRTNVSDIRTTVTSKFFPKTLLNKFTLGDFHYPILPTRIDKTSQEYQDHLQKYDEHMQSRASPAFFKERHQRNTYGV